MLTGFFRLLLVSVLSVGLVGSAAALTIDSFEEGAFSLSTTTSVTDTQSGLSTSNVLSGQRQVDLTAGGGDAVAADLTLTAGDDGVGFSDPGNGGGNASIEVRYDFISPVDLTSAGSNDRFAITFVDVVAGTLMDFHISATDGINTSGSGITFLDGGGTFEFLFSDFATPPLDFTQIGEILVTVQAGIGPPAKSFTLTNFSAIPEPSSVLLLASGLAGLALRRRRA